MKKHPNHMLRSYYSKRDDEFIIEGNEDGLRYMLEVLEALIRNEPGTPACHVHFLEGEYLLEEGSLSFRIAKVVQ